MKRTVGILSVLAIFLGGFGNVAMAAEVNTPILYEEVTFLEQVEITTETSVRLAEDGAIFSNGRREGVNLTDLESTELDVAQIVVNDVLSNARATGSITWDIPAGATGKGKTSFSMEAGESITINCSYSPRSASVDFGLLAPNGRFYHMEGQNGSINQTIIVDMRGEYYLAIRNNSSNIVSVYGFVNY